MKRLSLLLGAALPLAAAYSPYESNTFAAPPANWQAAGALQYGASGLTATGTSGSLVYTAASGVFQEVRLDIAITASGGTYTAYLLAGSTDLATANLYALEVDNPYVDANGCWAPTRLWKRVNGQVYDLMSYTQSCRYNVSVRPTAFWTRRGVGSSVEG